MGIRSKKSMGFYHYVISDKVMSERKKNIIRSFTQWEITPNFFDAVIGKNLTQKQLKMLSCDYGLLKLGAIGCALSHLGIYKKFLSTAEKCVYVFEDDVQLTEDFIRLQPKIQQFMNKRTEPTVLALYKFDGLKKKVDKLDDGVYIMRSLAGTASHAYVINRGAAENLLKAQTPVRIEMDAWAIYQKLGFLNLYCVNRDLVRLNENLSCVSTIEIESDGLNNTKIKQYHFRYWYDQLSVADKIRFIVRRLLRHIQELYYEKE